MSVQARNSVAAACYDRGSIPLRMVRNERRSDAGCCGLLLDCWFTALLERSDGLVCVAATLACAVAISFVLGQLRYDDDDVVVVVAAAAAEFISETTIVSHIVVVVSVDGGSTTVAADCS